MPFFDILGKLELNLLHCIEWQRQYLVVYQSSCEGKRLAAEDAGCS